MTKQKKQLKTIHGYIATFSEGIHVLGNIRFQIRESAPKAEEEISYENYVRLNGRGLGKTHRVLEDTLKSHVVCILK